MFNVLKIISIKVLVSLLLIGVNLLFGQSLSFAARQIFEATGSYCIENNNVDLVATAKHKAREIALKNAREKAGYYIESYLRVSNFFLAEDDLNITLGNVLNIISEKEEIESLPDGINTIYKCKIMAEIDTENIDFQKMKNYRKSTNMSIIDYYKKALVKLFEGNDGIVHYLKTDNIYYDSDGNMCCTLISEKDDSPDIGVTEYVINTVDRLCKVKFIRFYDKNSGELGITPETSFPVSIGQWYPFEKDSLTQYACNYIRGVEDKLNMDFLQTHFSSEKTFLCSLANKHLETKNNLLLSNHFIIRNTGDMNIICVEAFIPDTVEIIDNDRIRYKTISMNYSTDINPITDVDNFNSGGLTVYTISDWEFDRKKNTVIEKTITDYDPSTHKMTQKENSNILFMVPKQFSQNNLLVENALYDFYQQYLR